MMVIMTAATAQMRDNPTVTQPVTHVTRLYPNHDIIFDIFAECSVYNNLPDFWLGSEIGREHAQQKFDPSTSDAKKSCPHRIGAGKV